jgi:hypothetical protein
LQGIKKSNKNNDSCVKRKETKNYHKKQQVESSKTHNKKKPVKLNAIQPHHNAVAVYCAKTGQLSVRSQK